MLATATMVKSKACAPVALLASWSVRPTAIRLAILAPSRVVSAAARESSSESANREVDAESIGPIITHTQVRKTSVAALQPMSTAADQPRDDQRDRSDGAADVQTAKSEALDVGGVGLTHLRPCSRSLPGHLRTD